jgi:predicted aspartyl protease
MPIKNSSPAGRRGEVIPLQIIDLQDDGFHPLVEVVVFGQPFIAVLDTGASKTAFDRTMLEHANTDAIFESTDRLSTGLGTNTMASSKIVLDSMYIGGFLITDIEVAVLDLSAINHAYQQLNKPTVIGVVGGDILMKYKAIVDYGEGTLRLCNQ